MLEARLEKYFSVNSDFHCIGKFTWRECLENPNLIPDKTHCVYVVLSHDPASLYPLYVGSTKKGTKRIQDHARGYGCMKLKHIIECSAPETYNFLVYFYKIPVYYILRSVEYHIQSFLRPWIMTRVGKDSYVRILWHDDDKRGITLPDYIDKYNKEIETNTKMISDEMKRLNKRWEKEDEKAREIRERFEKGIKKEPDPACEYPGCVFLALRGEKYCAHHIVA